jgi:hypothetical protein
VVVLPKRAERAAPAPAQVVKSERSDWARLSIDLDVELLIRLHPGKDPQRLLDSLTQAVRAVLKREREGDT